MGGSSLKICVPLSSPGAGLTGTNLDLVHRKVSVQVVARACFIEIYETSFKLLREIKSYQIKLS